MNNDKLKKYVETKIAMYQYEEKWEEDKTSLRKSINYMCVQCFGGEDWEGVMM